MYKENSTDEQLQAVEDNLNSVSLLHLGNCTIDSTDPKEILYEILQKQRDSYTLDSNNEVQCNNDDKKRSQGDLYRIMKYYYPSLTFKQLRSLLLDLANEKRISSIYCGWINKRVFYPVEQYNFSVGREYLPAGTLYENRYYEVPTKRITDEFDLSFKKC